MYYIMYIDKMTEEEAVDVGPMGGGLTLFYAFLVWRRQRGMTTKKK
jgi:hypothetical protein